MNYPSNNQTNNQSNDSDVWELLEQIGRRTGHVVARCPRCHERCMIPYASPRVLATQAPRCRVCLPDPAPRVEVISDLSLMINRRPGQPRPRRQVMADGGIVRVIDPDQPSWWDGR